MFFFKKTLQLVIIIKYSLISLFKLLTMNFLKYQYIGKNKLEKS